MASRPLDTPGISTAVPASTNVKLIRSAAWLGGCFVCLTCLLAAGDAQQESPGTNEAIEWRTGVELQKQLRARVSIQWQEAEFKPRLDSLAADQKVAVFLDRRIDPNQRLDFARDGLTLAELFDELAEAFKAGKCAVGPVCYIGPPATAATLVKTLAQRRKEVGRHPALARARSQRLQWNELSEPRQLLIDVARQHSLTIANPQAVPHDLWPAADLPLLSLAEQLTLLLAGFDLTFELSTDGRQMRLVPLPAYVEGEQVARRPENPGTKGRPPAQESIRYTLTLTNESAGAVVNAVAKRLGRQLKCSAPVREKLSAKFDLKVSDATLEELMDKTLTPLGLTYRLTKETLEVSEKEM